MCKIIYFLMLISLFCVNFLHSSESHSSYIKHNNHSHHNHHHKHQYNKNSTHLHAVNNFQIDFNNSSSKYSIVNSPYPRTLQPTVNHSWRKTSENDLYQGNERPVKRVVTKSDPSKHICTEKRTVHIPVKRREVYSKPTRQFINETCNDQKVCTGTRVIHQTTEREIIRHRVVGKIFQICCPGWDTKTTIAEGCFKPICQKPCLNGGQCTQPDTCTCGQGFTGKYCERDINECLEKPCDQSCYNTEGSYYCVCREGFFLHSDRRSCKKMARTNDIDAFEVKDLENDIDYDDLNARVTSLEKLMLMEAKKSQEATNDLNKRLQYALDTVSHMKAQLYRMEQQQQNIITRQNQQTAHSTTRHSRPVNNPATDIMFKCQNKSVYCPPYH